VDNAGDENDAAIVAQKWLVPAGESGEQRFHDGAEPRARVSRFGHDRSTPLAGVHKLLCLSSIQIASLLSCRLCAKIEAIWERLVKTMDLYKGRVDG
jgi:hypothetical protein